MLYGIIIILILLIPILAIVLDSQVGRALAARLEPGSRLEDGEPMAERLRYLEEEVERLQGEVDRLGEESRFLQKLLAERPARDEPRPPGDEPD